VRPPRDRIEADSGARRGNRERIGAVPPLEADERVLEHHGPRVFTPARARAGQRPGQRNAIFGRVIGVEQSLDRTQATIEELVHRDRVEARRGARVIARPQLVVESGSAPHDGLHHRAPAQDVPVPAEGDDRRAVIVEDLRHVCQIDMRGGSGIGRATERAGRTRGRLAELLVEVAGQCIELVLDSQRDDVRQSGPRRVLADEPFDAPVDVVAEVPAEAIAAGLQRRRCSECSHQRAHDPVIGIGVAAAARENACEYARPEQ
jgi:hypothetical protein